MERVNVRNAQKANGLFTIASVSDNLPAALGDASVLWYAEGS
jgi:hypothetical protein